MWLVNLGDHLGRKTHLKKYLPYNGKWQFFPVAKVNVRPRSDFGFTPKSYEERAVPIPLVLLEAPPGIGARLPYRSASPAEE